MKNNINIPTKIIYYSDNIDILRGINSETIDLIYLDPPFNKNDTFVGTNERVHEIKEWYVGLQQERGMFTDEDFDEVFKDNVRFKDIWNHNDIQKEWYGQIDRYNHELINYFDSVRKTAVAGTFFYLIFMTIRLIEMHRILKDSGSIYLHCDSTMSHYLKVLLDKIFGHSNFRNEIIWQRIKAGKSSQHKSASWGRNTDTILFYTKSSTYTLRPFKALTQKEIQEKFNKIDDAGNRYLDDTSHIFRPMKLGERPNLCYEWRGFKNPHPSGWVMSKERIEEEYQKGNIVINTGKLERRKYLRDYEGYSCGNFWQDIKIPSQTEKTGYPTQKPLALLERIIEASSNKGEVVLDPFCGCATTCVAAEKLERKWIGIDWNKQAYYMVYYRLHKSLVNTGEQAGLHMLYKNIILETKPPARTDADEELFYRVKTKQELKTYKITTTEIAKVDPQYRKEAIDLLFDEQGGFCNGCNERVHITNLTLDHIEPWSKTHNNDIDNLQLLCYRCNVWKRDGTMMELIEKLYREKVITKVLYMGQKQKYGAKNKEKGK